MFDTTFEPAIMTPRGGAGTCTRVLAGSIRLAGIGRQEAQGVTLLPNKGDLYERLFHPKGKGWRYDSPSRNPVHSTGSKQKPRPRAEFKERGDSKT